MQRPFRPPGRLKGPDHCWRAMRELSPDGFTVRDIHDACAGGTIRTVKSYVRWCLERGHVEKIAEKPSKRSIKAHVYRVADGAPRTAPVQRRDAYTGERGRVKEHLWTAMRALPAFTITELAFAASTEDLPIKPHTADSYVRQLVKGGALIVITPHRKGAPGRTGAHPGKWRLKPRANTGPKPLKWIKGRVYDPNCDQWLGPPPPSEKEGAA